MNALYKYIKSLDMFGKDVRMQIRGTSSFQTFPGAIFSIINYVTTLIFLVYFGQEVFEKTKPKYLDLSILKKEDSILSLSRGDVNDKAFNVFSFGFYFGIKLTTSNGTVINDPRAFTYTSSLIKKQNLPSGLITVNSIAPIVIKPCATITDPNLMYNRIMEYYNSTYLQQNQRTFMCPNFENSTIGYNSIEDSHTGPTVEVYRCGKNLENNCYSDLELIALYGPTIQVTLKTFHYITNPLKYLDDHLKVIFEDNTYSIKTVGNRYLLT